MCGFNLASLRPVLVVASSLIVCGCGSIGSEPYPDVSSAMGDDDAATGASAPSVQVDDLGTIIAEGQTIAHAFSLKNDTGRILRILKASASTPCCSSIGPLPATIPAGGEARVPVELRPGHQSGLKRVRFSIETDDARRPTSEFVLDARLIPDWEFKPAPDDRSSFPIGEKGTRKFRFVSRRRGDKDSVFPSAKVVSPLILVASAPMDVHGDLDLIAEVGGEVVVEVPKATSRGLGRGEIVFRWPDGSSKVETISWDVLPRLRAVPPGLTIRHSGRPSEVRIRITSDDRPFRVAKVESPLLVGRVDPPTEPNRVHDLVLTLDAARAESAGGVHDLVITTDHPEQPVAKVAVLVVPFSP